MAYKIRLTTVPGDAKPEDMFAIVERDGGVIVKDFLDRDTLARLNGDLAPIIEASAPGSRSGDKLWETFHGHRTKRICGLAAKSPAFVEVMCDDRMKAYGDHFMLPNCGSYWLNTSQLMIIAPGEPAQFLHRDEGNWPHFPWRGPELTVSSMFALREFTDENGATLVAPGSHRWDDPARIPTSDELTQAAMTAGSVLFYTGKTIHGAGANRSSQTRYGMHISWVLGWLRPEENHYLAVPVEVARTLPPRAQQMLGYTAYHPSTAGGRLGLVDFEDPALTPEAAAMAKRPASFTIPESSAK